MKPYLSLSFTSSIICQSNVDHPLPGLIPCRFGPSCNNPVCSFAHPSSLLVPPSQRLPCWYGSLCHNQFCRFIHPPNHFVWKKTLKWNGVNGRKAKVISQVGSLGKIHRLVGRKSLMKNMSSPSKSMDFDLNSRKVSQPKEEQEREEQEEQEEESECLLIEPSGLFDSSIEQNLEPPFDPSSLISQSDFPSDFDEAIHLSSSENFSSSPIPLTPRSTSSSPSLSFSPRLGRSRPSSDPNDVLTSDYEEDEDSILGDEEVSLSCPGA